MRKLSLRVSVTILAALLSFVLVSWAAGNTFFSENRPEPTGNFQAKGDVQITGGRPGNGVGKERTSTRPDRPASGAPTAVPLAYANPGDASGVNKPADIYGDGSNGPEPETTASDSFLKGPAAGVIWSLPTKKRAVFITIDDGWFPSWPLLKMMQEDHLPITAFLIQKAVEEHVDYWRAFIAAGGDVEDHTYSHPYLTRLAPAAIKAQISRPVSYYRELGARTSLFRPPYDVYDRTVCQAAYAAGIRKVVLWNAVMEKGILRTYDGRPLQPGAIILMHWVPDLSQQLNKLLSILRKQDLGVADLATAINNPADLKVTRLKVPVPPGEPTGTGKG